MMSESTTTRLSAAALSSPDVAGVVLAHSPAHTRCFIGSPGIAVLPGGDYLAKCDLFGPASGAEVVGISRILRSSDRGVTWRHVTDLSGIFWASLFVHYGDVYLMGTDRANGRMVIRRSRDGGRDWTTPLDERSGLLSRDAGYHCAPVPVLLHEGRLWRAMEDTRGPGGWGTQFRTFVMSAGADDNLLDAINWRTSQRLVSDTRWLGGQFGGWLEGNMVVAPDGSLANVLRVDYRGTPEKAAIVRLSPRGYELRFDPEPDLVDFPGGCKKFTIRFDAQSGHYWSLSNHVPEKHLGGNAERTRNTLTLIRSSDLRHWEIRDVVLYHPDVQRHGYHYVDWLIEGDDLIAVARTAGDDAFGGAQSQHDANCLTFHRIERFRTRG